MDGAHSSGQGRRAAAGLALSVAIAQLGEALVRRFTAVGSSSRGECMREGGADSTAHPSTGGWVLLPVAL